MKLQHILEKMIANVSKRVSVDIALAIDQSSHGEDRRYRHTDDQGNEGIISHSEIVSTVSKALPKIAQLAVEGSLKDKGTVVIFNKITSLNIVGAIDLVNDTFKVITIMKKENFVPKQGDTKIEV